MSNTENWREKSLLKFSDDPKDFWTVDDAMKGTCIMGGTGGGKTTASGRTLATQFLKQGWGGIVLCAKTDEAQSWLQYCADTNRTDDVIWFKKGAVHLDGIHVGKTMVFNPLHYEMTRKGEGAKEAFNITNIFMNVYKMGNRISNEEQGGGQNERFWDSALRRLLNRSIELINFIKEDLTYRNMINLIYSSPKEKEPFDDNVFANFIQMAKYKEDYEEQLNGNFFLKCLAEAFLIIEPLDINSPEYYTFDSIFKYFTESLPKMSEQTHNAVIESFMGIADPFLSGILNTHFSGETNLYPEETYTNKKIIILDFPVKEFLETGIMAQSIFKLIFQQAVERRNVEKFPTPVFLWADEAQYFINPYDQIFLTTARGSRAATVFLSQNIPNYQAAMGGQQSMPRVNSLMGNLATKIFHANSDAVTNEYASTLIGQTVSFLSRTGFSHTMFSLNFNKSKDTNATFLPQIQPMEFTMMKSGGEHNNYEVEAIVFATGKKWSTGTNFIRTIFEQNFS